MSTNSVFFRLTDTGLTPTFLRFVNRATLADLSGSAPTISEVGYGEYKFTYTPTVDVSFTVDGGVSLPTDSRYISGVLEVKSDLSVIYDMLTRAIGLMHENSVLDQTAYDGSNNLTAGRLRLYDSKANAQAAGATGLVATYTITATYIGSNLSTYSVMREP